MAFAHHRIFWGGWCQRITCGLSSLMGVNAIIMDLLSCNLLYFRSSKRSSRMPTTTRGVLLEWAAMKSYTWP
ncbi:hypothetical protein C8F01DRAFT_1118848 [Mycena amicta]|nr:hypothetical protein C8F01DRAFT_1118848 [Mycena amicta]